MGEKRNALADGAETLVHTRWQKLALAGAALVAAGFVPAPGMGYSALVLVPYAATLVCAGLAARRFARLTSPLDPRKKRDLTDHVRSLSRRLAAGAVAAVVTMLGEAAFLASGYALEPSEIPWAVLLLALMAAAAALLASLRRDVEALPVG